MTRGKEVGTVAVRNRCGLGDFNSRSLEIFKEAQEFAVWALAARGQQAIETNR